MIPRNEADTLALYETVQEYLGWQIVFKQVAFPDVVIENRNGIQLIAEFEYEARNFDWHGHPADGCDLIICWRNNWPGAPLPVWELESTLPPIDPLWVTWACNWPDHRLEELNQRIEKLSDELSMAYAWIEKKAGLMFCTTDAGTFFIPRGQKQQRCSRCREWFTVSDWAEISLCFSCARHLCNWNEPPAVAAALDNLGL